MGSTIELNDTLKLTPAEGLPVNPQVGQVYEFRKDGRRLYHLAPTRVFLVEDRAGRWNYLGHAHVLELTIDAERDQTRGKYRITQLYPPDYAMLANQYEAPAGKGLTGKHRGTA
ncbi:MAG: hypothetical protein K8T26_19915 [Lentisphaerae bacterium]|nr:hypothetical protein [Lentisphaerota bacterium]